MTKIALALGRASPAVRRLLVGFGPSPGWREQRNVSLPFRLACSRSRSCVLRDRVFTLNGYQRVHFACGACFVGDQILVPSKVMEILCIVFLFCIFVLPFTEFGSTTHSE